MLHKLRFVLIERISLDGQEAPDGGHVDAAVPLVHDRFLLRHDEEVREGVVLVPALAPVRLPELRDAEVGEVRGRRVLL